MNVKNFLKFVIRIVTTRRVPSTAAAETDSCWDTMVNVKKVPLELHESCNILFNKRVRYKLKRGLHRLTSSIREIIYSLSIAMYPINLFPQCGIESALTDGMSYFSCLKLLYLFKASILPKML